MNFKKIIFASLLILFGVYVVYQIVAYRQELTSFQSHFTNLNLLLLIISLFLVYPVDVITWHILTMLIGIRLDFSANAKIWLVSNLIRLIPGGIFQYPSRIILLSRAGVSKLLATKAVVLEILFNLMAGCLITLVSLKTWDLPQTLFTQRIYFYLFILVVFFSILLLSLGFADRVISWGAKLREKNLNITHLKFSPFLVLPLILIFSLRNIVTGAVLYFLLQGLSVAGNINFWEVIGKFSLSWIIGYLAFFAPAGLGVMEATLTGLLSANVGIGIAAVSAIVFRILLLTSELVFVIVFNCAKIKKTKV